MSGIGVNEAARRSGLTREQIIYLDEMTLLGTVARHKDARRFSEEQVQWLERYGHLRRMGLLGAQAAKLAEAQAASGAEELSALCEIADAQGQQIGRAVSAWLHLCALINRSAKASVQHGVGKASDPPRVPGERP